MSRVSRVLLALTLSWSLAFEVIAAPPAPPHTTGAPPANAPRIGPESSASGRPEPAAPTIQVAPADTSPTGSVIAPQAQDFRRPATNDLTIQTPLADTPQHGNVLVLSEVLDSVKKYDPRIRAARQQIDYADARLLSFRGAFDTMASFEHMYQPLYRNTLTRFRIDQPTKLHGLTAWVAYQKGSTRSRINVSNCSMPGLIDLDGCGRQITASGGEFFLGFTLPLLQGGWTDRRRTDIKQSKLEHERMKDIRDVTQLTLELEAATAYWHWVAAGLDLKIEQQLLNLAVIRNDKLLRQIELGALNQLAGLENKRLILDRQARIVMAERDMRGAALDLSLYLRDENGDPVVVPPERSPSVAPAMPSPRKHDLDSDIALALKQRPDRRAQGRSLDQAAAELRLARNQLFPRADISAIFSQEIGRYSTFSKDPAEVDRERNAIALPTELVTWLNVQVPIPLRNARGQIRSAESSLSIIRAEMQLLKNQITVQVADSHIAVEAAHRQALLASQQVGITKELAQAELKRFEVGDGDLMLVNLRELAIADAASAEVKAISEYFIAKAQLEVTKGKGVQNVLLN